MAGGKGTRFWPFSRLKTPKQFLTVLGDKPLIDYTLDRVTTFCDLDNCWLLANHEQSEYLDTIRSIKQENILREPFGKNTAACIIWGAFEALKRDPDAILVNVSADAWINDDAAFSDSIKKAIAEVEANNSVVTIGIPARSAHTGYGYIQVNKEQMQADIQSVLSFTEKPDEATANAYIKAGNYFWNAGIFVWRASTLLQLAKEHLPTHYDLLKSMSDAELSNADDLSLYYGQLENISIDYGILEKIEGAIKLVPARFDWDDIGSWASLEQYLEKDAFQNAIRGSVISIDSNRNIIFSNKDKLIALSHINDCIIVDSDDALLIVPKAQDQHIKAIYDKLPEQYK